MQNRTRMWSFIWKIHKRLSNVKKSCVKVMFGQLFGSLCFDFHKPGLALPDLHQRLQQGGAIFSLASSPMRVPSSVQLKTPCRQWKVRKPAHWNVNLIGFPSTALCPRHRCVRPSVFILFAATSDVEGLVAVLTQSQLTARFCREVLLLQRV